MTSNPEDALASPHSYVQQELIRIWSEVLKNDQIDINESIFALGGDSISSLLIAAKALSAGIRITALQVLEKETVAQLAEVAEIDKDEAEPNDDRVENFGETDLTPIQHWFFEQNLPDINHWNMAVFVDIHKELDEEILHQALVRVIEHHDALRSKFYRLDGKWVQLVTEDVCEFRLNVINVPEPDGRGRWERLRQASLEAQTAIDIARGRLVAAVLYRTPDPSPDQFLLVVHHLVVDSVSMRVLIRDLEAAYYMLTAGRDVTLPTRSVSLRSWSGQLARYATSPYVLDQLNYWRAVPKPKSGSVYFGGRPHAMTPSNTVGHTGAVKIKVPPWIVSELTNNGYRIAEATLRDALLAGFILAWREQTGRSAFQLDLESHGREELDQFIDITRTVGWFTAIYPVFLQIPESVKKIDVLRVVHEQLDRIPGGGIGYGLLRYLAGPEGAALAQLEQSQVNFNYLGRFDDTGDDRLFGPPMPTPGPLQDAEAPRRYLLEIVISGTRGAIDVDFVYARDFLPKRSVRTLACSYRSILEEIAHELAEYPPPTALALSFHAGRPATGMAQLLPAAKPAIAGGAHGKDCRRLIARTPPNYDIQDEISISPIPWGSSG